MIRTLASLMAIVWLSALHPQAQATQTKAVARTPSGQVLTKPALINLNTATVKDLEGLPGIGTKIAERIVEYRTKQGPFKKIEDLMNVQGIGEKSFLKLKPQLTVAKPDSSTP